jgi:hypothetical protein
MPANTYRAKKMIRPTLLESSCFPRAENPRERLQYSREIRFPRGVRQDLYLGKGFNTLGKSGDMPLQCIRVKVLSLGESFVGNKKYVDHNIEKTIYI